MGKHHEKIWGENIQIGGRIGNKKFNLGTGLDVRWWAGCTDSELKMMELVRQRSSRRQDMWRIEGRRSRRESTAKER